MQLTALQGTYKGDNCTFQNNQHRCGISYHSKHLWYKKTEPSEVFVNEELNLLKPTGYVMHHQFNIQQLYTLPTLYLCVLYVFIWEQTANCATYSINWLVFVTELKSVYSAVRTGSSK
jgi:hypothetical protein